MNGESFYIKICRETGIPVTVRTAYERDVMSWDHAITEAFRLGRYYNLRPIEEMKSHEGIEVRGH